MTPFDLAQVLWPEHPAAVLMCTHAPSLPAMCADHTDAGLMCERCLITHCDLKHAELKDNIPADCTLCQEPITQQEWDSALTVAEHLGVPTMRTAHDVFTLARPTADVLLVGRHKDHGLVDAIYTGPIRLWGGAWLCDRCRSATPPDTVIDFDVSPSRDGESAQ